MDPWDVMSTAANTFMAPHPYFTELDVRANPIFRVGPGLNAANMWGRGWLDGSRLWSSVSNAQVNTVVQLRPLHRRDLPGFLAIQLEEYFVEFRINENWDAAIAPTVLVHKIGNIPSEGIVSYLLSDSSGQQAFGAGSFIGMPGVTSIFGSSTRIEVVGIDAGQQFATVRLVHTPAHAPQSRPPDGPYRNPEVAWSDFVGRGDAQVIVDGIVARVSRRSPFFRMLEQIALFENSEAIASVRLQNAVKAEALSTIAVITQEQMHKLQAFRQPAPSLQTEVRDGTISSLEEAFQEHLRPDVKQKH
jgi:hypothetical protein